MELKTFYRTQRDLAEALNRIVDAYFCDEMNEEKLIESIKLIAENNQTKLFKDEHYSKIVIQKCGKRRLEIISKILNVDEDK